MEEEEVSEKENPFAILQLREVFSHRWFGLAIKAIVYIAIFLVLAPLLLILIYAVPSTHPVSTKMVGRYLTLQETDRQWTDLDDISPALARSVLMSEDGQFCFHRGVDWKELNTIIEDAIAGERTRGASTLPMQTVKNLFLWSGRSYIRKALEIPLALAADLVWSKRRTMEIYLNIVEWGDGAFGAEAAARLHFNRSASKLTNRQAALLAVALPNPIKRNPAKPTRQLNRLAGIVEKRANRSRAYIACLDAKSPAAQPQ